MENILKTGTVIHMDKSSRTINSVSDFMRDNECFMPEPISKCVDLKEWAEKLVSNGEVFAYMADDKLVGIACGYINDLQSKKAYLQLLLVNGEYQKRGGGYTLIRCFSDCAKNRGFGFVQLTVDLCNENAIAFYIRQGFVKSEEEHPNKKKQYMILRI